ncbi:Low-density lipoprotein receptor domain class A [Oesophagostomum dentatum]|uniref:Low-density lipoprotein receptor domain class A n=1 Tax=Oesophagostomum dentatum TaxID=61180 RepID=A0A0B1SGI0_OESDE|nr:Low-density lipoprotein receptor domain class A [Oesophagostomum dentatum]
MSFLFLYFFYSVSGHFLRALTPVLTVCLPWQVDCGFGSPRCISKKKLNDGKIDCYSGLDEGCPSHFFVCKDKSTCIEPELFQDGKRHCADGSDEPCPPGQFPCSDGSKCIPHAKFQNGVEDCSDGSDEGQQFVYSKSCVLLCRSSVRSR